MCAAPKGNQFWKQRSSHGRKPIIATPEIFRNACYEYFEWVEDNPLYETKVFHSTGIITKTEIPKMRAMTIDGLCLFLGIGIQTWYDYRNREDFSDVVHEVERITKVQKFEGAAAGLLNPNIIARDLGLADKKEHTGSDGGPIQMVNAPPAFKTIEEWEAWNRKVNNNVEQ